MATLCLRQLEPVDDHSSQCPVAEHELIALVGLIDIQLESGLILVCPGDVELVFVLIIYEGHFVTGFVSKIFFQLCAEYYMAEPVQSDIISGSSFVPVFFLWAECDQV
ncbi:MAG: hypothetical protein IPN68_17775 [Bacteroidetes bacterium]|nr:hypothetical protein [Bacteroidota bacterium]